MGATGSKALEGWPAGVPVRKGEFENWAGTQRIGGLWIAAPRTAEDCVAICNWAARIPGEVRGEVRPAGACWSWSPLVFSANDTQRAERYDLMIDMTTCLETFEVNYTQSVVTLSPGYKIETALDKLDSEGLTLAAYTGSGKMTLGGCVAVGAKGNLVPSDNDAPGTVFGSMTNTVVGFTAVVSDDGGRTYEQREFKRGTPEADLLLAGLGRTLVTKLKLKVMKQYNAKAVSTFDITASQMFAAPSPAGQKDPENSYAALTRRHGRVSAIYIPYTEACWTRHWSCCPVKPASAREVRGPYNYVYQDGVQGWQTFMFEAALGQPYKSPLAEIAHKIERPFTAGVPGPLERTAVAVGTAAQELEEDIGAAHQLSRLTRYYDMMQSKVLPRMNKKEQCEELWGKSHHVGLFVNSDLKISSHGIAVICRREEMQRAVHTTFSLVKELVDEYAGKETPEYPLSGQVEWRASALDDGKYVGVPNSSPALTSGHVDPETIARTGWDVMLVIEVIYFPRTTGFNKFALELEERFNAHPLLSGDNARVLPEWSKQFATTAEGGEWANTAEVRRVRSLFPRWGDAVAAQRKYDPAGLFETRFNRWLLTE